MSGPYVVEGPLGRGGMGVVELATGPDGEKVALKRVALAGSADALAAARARIRREAEVLEQLHHPAIVELLDVLDDGDDLVLVMPWLRGGSLADRGVRPAAEVDAIADHLLGALAAAHRAGIVHRDVKPANVLFDEHSRPLLADFGVASARDVTAGLTMAGGGPVGTAGFLAPEQARGETAGPAADVFSLGATLRWAVTGLGPYGEGPTETLLWRASRGKVERCPKSVPAPLRARIDAMLDPRPERRPTAAALAGGPDGTGVVAPPARRARWWIPAAAALVVAAGIAAAVAATAGDGTEAATTTTSEPEPTTTIPPCLPDHADYDGVVANGCEAAPDDLDGTPLDDELAPNLVPTDDVDEFPVEVADGFQVLCDGELRITVTAPAGASVRLEVLTEDGDLLGETTSADGVAGTARLAEPDCGGDDSQTLTARVSSIGSDRTAEPYTLARSGGW
jgi:hypothetical protein